MATPRVSPSEGENSAIEPRLRNYQMQMVLKLHAAAKREVRTRFRDEISVLHVDAANKKTTREEIRDDALMSWSSGMLGMAFRGMRFYPVLNLFAHGPIGRTSGQNRFYDTVRRDFTTVSTYDAPQTAGSRTLRGP